jgi:hypothetical protein
MPGRARHWKTRFPGTGSDDVLPLKIHSPSWGFIPAAVISSSQSLLIGRQLAKHLCSPKDFLLVLTNSLTGYVSLISGNYLRGLLPHSFSFALY